MSVRTAELVAAVILALCSAAIMVKSAELNIGWVKDKGPGSGAWPFWLATGMLLSCLATIVRWFRGKTPESRSREPYLTRESLAIVGASIVALLLLLVVTQWLGLYAALPLFLFGYILLIGGHDWRVAFSIAVLMTIGVFALFEWALQIPLPKAATEELFYPVYDLMYAQGAAERLRALAAPVVGVPLALATLIVLYWIVHFARRRPSGPSPAATPAGEEGGGG